MYICIFVNICIFVYMCLYIYIHTHLSSRSVRSFINSFVRFVAAFPWLLVTSSVLTCTRIQRYSKEIWIIQLDTAMFNVCWFGSPYFPTFGSLGAGASPQNAPWIAPVSQVYPRVSEHPGWPMESWLAWLRTQVPVDVQGTFLGRSWSVQ